MKTINYFNGVWLHDELIKNDAIDVLYHHDGFLQELSKSNLFLVKDSVLITPASGVLAGVTRSKVLEVARSILPVEVRDVKLEELEIADEAFITGTLKKVMSIVFIDGRTVGDGKPGDFTKQVMVLFEESVQKYLNRYSL